jgi:hypothetical protein
VEILVMLLQHPGETITREELQKKGFLRLRFTVNAVHEGGFLQSWGLPLEIEPIQIACAIFSVAR